MSDLNGATSTWQEIAVNDLPYPAPNDFASWNTLNSPVPWNYTASDYLVTLGVWGADLTAFKTDCALSTVCDPVRFASFDGWALGATINFPLHDGAPDNGFCFANTNVCTLGYYGTKKNPRIYTENMSAYAGVDANNPGHADLIQSPELAQYYGLNTWDSWAF